MKKIIGPGLLAGLFMLIINLVVSFLFMLIPSVKAEYASSIMRGYNDPLMWLFFLYPFILGIIFALVWNKVKGSFKGKERGCHFGWMLFLLTTLPGMYITYTSFNLSFLIVLSWMLSGLISAKIAGFYLVKANP